MAVLRDGRIHLGRHLTTDFDRYSTAQSNKYAIGFLKSLFPEREVIPLQLIKDDPIPGGEQARWPAPLHHAPSGQEVLIGPFSVGVEVDYSLDRPPADRTELGVTIRPHAAVLGGSIDALQTVAGSFVHSHRVVALLRSRYRGHLCR